MFKMRTGNESRNGSRTRRTALRRMLLAFAVMLACLCLPASAQAASKANKALTAYNKILKSGKRSGMKIKFFALQDVNQDGVKELFLMNGVKGSYASGAVRDYAQMIICGYNGSKVVNVYVSDKWGDGKTATCWTLESDVLCYPSAHAVEIYGTGGTGESYRFVKISSGLTLSYKKFEATEDYPDWECEIDGKSTSKSTYDKQLSSWKSSCEKGTAVQLKVYDNTASNRTKYCKVASSTDTGSKAKISRTSGSVYVGKSCTLKVSGYSGTVKWSSSNKKVATVSSSGVVTGKKAGKATITAKVGKRKLKCKITVRSVFSVKKKSITINRTGTIRVSVKVATTVCFRSENDKIVTGSWKSGGGFVLKLTGRKKGTVYIRLTNKYNNEVIRIKVKVKKAAKSMVTGNSGSNSGQSSSTSGSTSETGSSGSSSSGIDSTGTGSNSGTVNPYVVISGGSTGTSCQLTSSVYPTGCAVTWSSSDSSVAAVSSDGTVTAKGAGSAKITASITYGGKTYSSSKTVSVQENISYGSWSSYSIDEATESDSQQVRTTTMYRYYYFYCPVCGGREPYQGKSDCGQYTMSLSDGHVGWFTTPYSQSNSQAYSYAPAKRYTTSLGDGLKWNFTASEINVTTIGYYSTEASDIIVRKGYSTRPIYRSYTISAFT